MNKEHAPSQEHLEELRQIRRAIRRSAAMIAGALILSTLIVVGSFAPNGEIVWTCMVIAGVLWALVVGMGSTIRRFSERRISARIDRERKAALSGRPSNLSPITK